MNIKRAGIAVAIGCGTNLLLFLIKLYVGISSNSISVYADSLNNLFDAFACAGAVAGFYLLSAKPSEKYPYGKGRGEDIAGLAVAAMVAFAGVSFVYASLERLMYPAPVWFSTEYALIIAATLPVKLLLAFVFRSSDKNSPSRVTHGLYIDSLLDFFITLATLFSFTVSEFVSFSVDGAVGVLIGAVLAADGVKMIVSAFCVLLGKRDDGACAEAHKILGSVKEITRVENVQCHSYGRRKIITADIETNCENTRLLREITDVAKEEIKRQLNAEIYFSFGGKD